MEKNFHGVPPLPLYAPSPPRKFGVFLTGMDFLGWRTWTGPVRMDSWTIKGWSRDGAGMGWMEKNRADGFVDFIHSRT